MSTRTSLGKYVEYASQRPLTEEDRTNRQTMSEYANLDPQEDGIPPREHARRIEYLNRVWWPHLLARVREQRLIWEQEHGESFIKHWQRIVNPKHQRSDSFVA